MRPAPDPRAKQKVGSGIGPPDSRESDEAPRRSGRAQLRHPVPLIVGSFTLAGTQRQFYPSPILSPAGCVTRSMRALCLARVSGSSSTTRHPPWLLTGSLGMVSLLSIATTQMLRLPLSIASPFFFGLASPSISLFFAVFVPRTHETLGLLYRSDPPGVC